MLFSQKEERSRQFSLALRAGLPILFLVSLIFYALIEETTSITISIKLATLVAAITFIAVYFIYFLIGLSVEESLIDVNSRRFNKDAFIHQLKNKKINTLALIQINNLKALNENYSPNQIDSLLYVFTKKLDLTLKQYGLKDIPIGKYHGSEFILAIQTSAEDTKSILNKILNDSKIIDNMEVDLTFSVINNNGDDFEKAITQLRDIIRTQAMHSEKDITTEIKDAKALSKIEQNIISAIHRKKLQLSFRPLLNTKSKQVDIYEISVKLSAEKEDILPRVFLPIINRLGLGRDYDYILIESAVSLLKLIDKDISFSFNLSPFSLRDLSFQSKIFTLIEESNISAERLIIQLYERKTHHDLSGYLKTLKAFKRHGIRICIDNFGSSDASMEYMKHFKFDMVQFDRDYVTKLDNTTSYTMMQSLINMSKDLHIITVAKWVDKEKQKEKLTALGIDYLQGFGIGKPLSEHALLTQYN
jgi:EAL domain-containing protein (putative c-di-GMP-specific phosphodiesterase class I)